MMLEQNSQNNTLLGQLSVRQAIGYLLILSGLGAAFGVLFEIYTIFANPQTLMAFQRLFPDRLTMTWGSEVIGMSPEVMAYGLPILLLLIAAGMTRTLIDAGIKLLPPR